MTVKLLMTWDILPGREQEYFEFVVRELIPALQRMGLEPSDAWFTMYGSNQPQIMTEAQTSNLAEMERILNSPDWHDLNGRLLEYVGNLDYKVVEAKPGFQM
jgi:hypothetical protein